MRSLSVDTQSVFLSPSRNFEGERIPLKISKLILSCRDFHYLEDHAKLFWSRQNFFQKWSLSKSLIEAHFRYCGSILLGRRAFEKMIAAILEEFSKKDYLISEEAFGTWLSTKTSSQSTPAISSLGIITCDRVESLKLSLNTYSQNLKKYDRSCEVVVCDDSKSPAVRNQNKAAAYEIAARNGVGVLYAGYDEKKNFALALTHEGLPADVVDFALFDLVNSQYSYGANCNSFYLHSAGELVFVSDDDTVCRIARAPEFTEGLSYIPSGSASDLWFYNNASEAIESAQFVDTDLLKLHEEFLGKTPSHVFESYYKNSKLACSKMDQALLENLRYQEATVSLTLNGLLGDSGSNSPLPFLALSDPGRRRILASKEIYDSIYVSREMAKAPPQNVFTPAGPCMSTFYGADNRVLVPPFFPYYRNCDALWGDMFKLLGRGEYFVYLPWMLLHSPPELRKYRKAEMFQHVISGMTPELCIRGILSGETGTPLSNDYSRNLKRIADLILDFASTSPSEFEGAVNQLLLGLKIQNLRLYETLLKQYPDSPPYWKEDILALRNTLLMSIDKKNEVLSASAQEKKAKDLETLQSQIFMFARLLRLWPDMVETSKSLKRQGVRLAQSLKN